MSHRLIAGHTPDVCWVGAGWVGRKAESVKLKAESLRLKAESVRLEAEGGKLEAEGLKLKAENLKLSDERGLPMEYREFQLGGQTEYVVFGHVVGGRSMSYGTGDLPPWYGFVADLWARGLRQREEQFFVRISSNRPLAEFQDTPPVRCFIQRLSVELAKQRRAIGDDRS
jgi:hypothetical protein